MGHVSDSKSQKVCEQLMIAMVGNWEKLRELKYREKEIWR